jgi:PAS domain S-box-containing protein
MKVAADNSFPVERADELFDQHRQEIFRNTDRLFARLMLFQWLAGILIAVLTSPRTWEGTSSHIHLHVWAAIFLGGAISIFPIWLTRIWPGAPVTRYVIAVAQMLMSALLIGLTGGRIETHFHVFGSLVILSFYRDWRVLIPATIIVALDHFIRGIYWPYSVYGVLAASPLRTLEHAGWVVFEEVFLVISCLRSIHEMRAIANRTAALEASEQGFRQIFEEAPIGMAVVDLEERFNKVNNVFCQMVGYSEAELAERTAPDITHADDVAEGAALAHALLNGKPRCAVEKRYVRRTGEVVQVLRTACLIRDQQGTPHHYLVMVQDITARKRAEEAVHQSHALLRAVIEGTEDAVYVKDIESRYLLINPAGARFLRASPEEIVGKRDSDFVSPESAAATVQWDAAVMAAGQSQTYEDTNEMVGEVRTFLSTKGPYRDHVGNVIGVVGISRDITMRKRNEEALEVAKDEAEKANRAKSEFLSRVSHELRTPLNAIIGFGQLIERQNPSEIQRTRVGHILNAGRHLLKLINEVLDISRIEAGNLQFSLEPVCADDALEEAIGLMTPLAAERAMEFSTSSVLGKNAYVRADRQRLKQVLLNLLTNAVKYAPREGKVVVTLSPGDKATTRIIISDNGSGIPADKLARLFTPFDRLGAEQTDVEGTGLGLALCQRLVQAMNGSIGVSSNPGRGSSFWIELPAAACPLGNVSGKHAATVREGGGKLKIVYVEDNLSNLRLLEEILAEQPEIELITAMHGRLGLDLVRRHSPDLVLLDLHLPDLPGWEVLAHLKRDETTREIPVVIISADATQGQIKRLTAAGAYAYLTKPLDIDELFRVVDQATTASKEPKECVAA